MKLVLNCRRLFSLEIIKDLGLFRIRLLNGSWVGFFFGENFVKKKIFVR